GGFAFEADAGIFDLRVQPDPTTGFGWLVAPQLALPPGDDSLSQLSVPLPIVYRGSVSIQDAMGPVPIPSPLIPAYADVTHDGMLATKPSADTVAIQVAEAHADDVNGTFTLLIPRTLGSD